MLKLSRLYICNAQTLKCSNVNWEKENTKSIDFSVIGEMISLEIFCIGTHIPWQLVVVIIKLMGFKEGAYGAHICYMPSILSTQCRNML